MTTMDPDSVQPGFVGERTDLAWDRSSLSLLGIGFVIVRDLALRTPPGRHVAAALVVLASGTLVAGLGQWHRRRRAARPGAAVPADVVPLAWGVTLVAAAAFVVGLGAAG